MKISLISLNQYWEKKTENLNRCKSLIEQAASEGCGLIIFPEMTLTGYSLETGKTAEEIENSESIKKFSELAAQYQLDIVFGICLREKETPLSQNSLIHANHLTGKHTKYTKIHPFTFAKEDLVMSSGDQLGIIEVSGIRLGTSICYDLRFPTLYTLMARQCSGAICIANWPASRVHHWRSLLIARAIENQMYMIAVNRVGEDGNGLHYEKSSMIVAPDGNICLPISSSEEIDIFDIDFTFTEEYRNNFPTYKDNNFDRYIKIFKELEISSHENN